MIRNIFIGLFIWLAVLVTLTQCKIDKTDLILRCDPSEYEIEEYTLCDPSVDYDPADFCEYENHGVASLLPGSRKHSRYMCPLMHSVIFEDESGHELIFQKSSYAAQNATQWSEKCSEMSDKSILHCASWEETIAVLLNDSLDMEFRIMLNIDHRDDKNRKDDRDQLLVTIPKTADFGKYYSLILSYYIKRDDVYESFNSRFRFEEEYVLEGKMYRDVTFFISSDDSDQMEIYYAKKFGIIGFRDMDGILWTFKRYG
jgi:hypothetical protein